MLGSCIAIASGGVDLVGYVLTGEAVVLGGPGAGEAPGVAGVAAVAAARGGRVVVGGTEGVAGHVVVVVPKVGWLVVGVGIGDSSTAAAALQIGGRAGGSAIPEDVGPCLVESDGGTSSRAGVGRHATAGAALPSVLGLGDG